MQSSWWLLRSSASVPITVWRTCGKSNQDMILFPVCFGTASSSTRLSLFGVPAAEQPSWARQCVAQLLLKGVEDAWH
jgi:hypothetical protein